MFHMKRARSNANFTRKKYSSSARVEQSGIGLRLLTEAEIDKMQSAVENIRRGQMQHPIRLKVPA